MQPLTRASHNIFHVLWLDREHPNAAPGQGVVRGHSGRHATRLPGRVAILINVNDMDALGGAYFASQTGGQSGRHIAAANERNRKFVFHRRAL
ncbi:hypothetical protein D3C77_721390 [compost metagenome]